MVAFLVLAGGVNLWSTHHFGVGLEDPKLLGGLGALLAGGARLLDKIADTQAQQSFWTRVNGWLQPLLSWPVLVVLYGLVAVLFVSRSSIAILPSEDGERLSARVSAVDDPDYHLEATAPAAGSVLRLPLRISGFGRPFRVEAEGYLSDLFTVPPLVGLRLRAGEELRPSPSILLRPSPDALRSLAGGGSLRVYDISTGSRTALVEDAKVDAASATPQKGASYLIGRSQPVPAALQATWRLELTATGLEAIQVADVLLQWSEPQVVAPEKQLEPGMKLEAEVRTRADRVKARAVIIVGTERLTDVPMTDVRDGSS
jgi:hypothetical protein